MTPRRVPVLWSVTTIFILCGVFLITFETRELRHRSLNRKAIAEDTNNISTEQPLNTYIGINSIATTAFDEIAKLASDEIYQKRASKRINNYQIATSRKTGGGLTDENRAVISEIYGKAQSVFEYGVGESTYIADSVGVERYVGVDNDPVWIANARDQVAPHFRFYLGDTGATEAWGYPSKKLSKSVWNYQLLPLASEPLPFDVYMVDGRFRFPCLLASFLHASARSGGPAAAAQTTVLVHDCFREEYHLADSLLELNQTGTQVVRGEVVQLCIYKRRPTTTDQNLEALWIQHSTQVA